MKYCSVTPDTKSGIDELARPSVTIDRSAIVLRRRAANMPAAMAIGMVITRPRAASLAERQNAGHSRSVTGTPDWNESPQSNVTALFSRRPYCWSSGSLAPISSFRASTVSCDANGPRMLRPTSSGQHVDDQEDDRRQQEQREDREQQPPDDVARSSPAASPTVQTCDAFSVNICPSADTRTPWKLLEWPER